MTSQRETNARYDRVAAVYDLCIIPTEALVRRERRRLLSQARGRTLELGIGTGASLAFYPPDRRVYGVDPSPEMLRRAIGRARSLHRPLGTAVMVAEALGYADATFDTVVATLVFCSVEDPMGALAEARRVLRPGGTLLLLEHVRPEGRLGRLFDRLDPWWVKRSCHLNRRTGELMTEAGFHIQSERRWAKSIFRAISATR